MNKSVCQFWVNGCCQIEAVMQRFASEPRKKRNCQRSVLPENDVTNRFERIYHSSGENLPKQRESQLKSLASSIPFMCGTCLSSPLPIVLLCIHLYSYCMLILQLPFFTPLQVIVILDTHREIKLMVPECFSDHILICDAIVGQGLTPDGVKCVVQCLGSKFIGLKDKWKKCLLDRSWH